MMNKHIFAMAACLAVVATPVLATDFKVEEATIPELEQAFRDYSEGRMGAIEPIYS